VLLEQTRAGLMNFFHDRIFKLLHLSLHAVRIA
jgi:hypothetical protein